MERHHKILIGGATSLMAALLITTSIFTYTLFIRQSLGFSRMNNELITLRGDTQNKINELSSTIMETQTHVQKLGYLNYSGDDFSGIISDSTKAVVTLKTEVGTGTGFLISKDGLIVSNAHILTGGNTLTILDYNSQPLPGQFIGYDLDMDIVVIKVLGENYDYLELTDSDEVQIGEKVIAIGNPLGLHYSVSEGIVSGIDRDGEINKGVYIQTDAALNPGNSGGPLINRAGKVIGINNFKLGGSENIGFALESNALRDTVNEIIAGQLNHTLLKW